MITEEVEMMQPNEIGFRVAAETTSAALFIFQSQQNISVNATAETITGYTREELLTMNFWDLIHPSFQEHIDKRSLAHQRSKSVPRQHQLKLITKNGKEIWVEVTLLTVFFRGTTALLGIVYDISPQKQEEAALRLSEAKFRGIFESSPDAIVIINHNDRITLVNLRTRQMFGYGQSELIDKPIELLLPDHAQKVKEQTHLERLSHPYMRTMNARLELVGKHKNGSEFPVAVKLSPIDLEEGLHITCIIRDITDYKQAEEHTIQAEHLAELGQIMTALAHELNNPLHIILGHLDLIQDFNLTSSENKQNLQIIRQEISRLTEVSQRILNYTSSRQLPRQLVSLADLITLVLVLVKKRAQQSRVRITTDLQDAPSVLAEPGPITQVFLNLITNGIESIGEDGLLHITLRAEGDQVVASFLSEAPPIPEAVMKHIFEPFFTTKPGGSGLGLWISHNLVKQHGGLLEARNLRNGGGVLFTVKLPIAPVSKAAAS